MKQDAKMEMDNNGRMKKEDALILIRRTTLTNEKLCCCTVDRVVEFRVRRTKNLSATHQPITVTDADVFQPGDVCWDDGDANV